MSKKELKKGIPKNWMQPRCSSIIEWINKLVHSYNGTLVNNKNN
jgi:hypothetical protein